MKKTMIISIGSFYITIYLPFNGAFNKLQRTFYLTGSNPKTVIFFGSYTIKLTDFCGLFLFDQIDCFLIGIIYQCGRIETIKG